MNDDIPIITLDGPSGAGKGTLASALAIELGWQLLDSGALYRLVALSALRNGLGPESPADCKRAVELARALPVHFIPMEDGPQRIELNGSDVTTDIRTTRVSDSASRWAAIPAIRQALLDRQRQFARRPGLVADGRDMGTVIFPDAGLKLFVTASAEERARRRFDQLSKSNSNATIDQLYRDIVERDRRDASREQSPLRPADDAHVIDTTNDDIATSLLKIRAFVADKGWNRTQ